MVTAGNPKRSITDAAWWIYDNTNPLNSSNNSDMANESVESWDWAALAHCACKSGTYLRTTQVSPGLTCVVCI